jgi:glycoside/pentoside/hexuronide:cation symporter, GPH family
MRLTPLHLAAYALPAIPIAALGQPFYMFAPTFYAREMGLAAGSIALVLLVVRVLDAGADLVSGRLSDLTTGPRLGRWGRRRPWVVGAAPLAALSAWMVLAPPDGAGVAWFAVWTLLISVSWAAIILPLNAWGAEIASGYRERITITAWREVATILGVIGAVAAVQVLSGPQGQLREALAALGLMVAVSTPLACGVCALLLPDPPPRQADPGTLLDGLRGAGANGPFRLLVGAWLVNGLANALPATLFLYFVSERLQRPDLQGVLLGAYFAMGLLGAPLWAWAGGRWGKHLVWCWAMAGACAVFGLALLVDGPEDWVLFLVVCLGSGLALGADVVLPAAMQADVVDLDRLATGAAPRTGVYFALWSVATKLTLALAAGIGFGVLALVGFETGQDAAGAQAQTPFALATLAGLYCGAPILLKLAAIAMIARYPITQAEQAKLQLRIDELEARTTAGTAR